MIRSLIAACLALVVLPAAAEDFFVLNTNPTGPSSLTAAIALANQTPGPDRIRFNIPGPGPHVIAPDWVLDATDTVEIDGYSQPGSAPNTAEFGSNANIRIVLSGANLPFMLNSALLTLRGYGSSVRGLAIVNGPYDTALRLEGGEHRIVGNFFGLHPDGLNTGSNRIALLAVGDFNLIGTPELADRNVFAASDIGIKLSGRGASRNVVRNNLFGASASGLQRRPLREHAVLVTDEASYNRIGDFGADTGNVVFGADTGAGVGVRIGGHATDTGAQESIGNAVLGNTLLGFRDRAIELRRAPGLCSPNDALDQDTGPNRCMNLPVIDSAILADGMLRVRGRIDSEPTTRPQFPQMFRVYLYGNGATCRGSLGEAEVPLAAQYDVAADAQGHATFAFDVPVGNAPPRSISAQLGIDELFVDSTSELSPCMPVATPPSAPTLTQALPGDGQATLHFTAPASNGGLPLLDYRIECGPGAVVANVIESPAIVGGLQNGIEYGCSIRARNAAGFGPPSATRTFTPRALIPPSFELPQTLNARVYEYMNLHFTVGGYPTPTVTLDGTLPPGLWFSGQSRQISGSPARGSVGSYTVTLRAENGVGAAVTHTLTIQVARGQAQIGIDTIDDHDLGDEPFVVELWSDSSAPLQVSSATPSVCSAQRVGLGGHIPSAAATSSKRGGADHTKGSSGAYAGALITLLGTGRCEFVVEQAADADFEAAEPAIGSFNVRGPVMFADGFE